MVFIHKLQFLLLNLLIAGTICASGLAIHAQETNVKEIISVDKSNSKSELSEKEKKRRNDIIFKRIGPNMVTKTYKTDLHPHFVLRKALRSVQQIFGRRLYLGRIKREKPVKMINSNGDEYIENFYFQVKCEKKTLDLIDGIITTLISEKRINKKFIIIEQGHEFIVHIHYFNKKIDFKKISLIPDRRKSNMGLINFFSKNAMLILLDKKNHRGNKKVFDEIIEIHKN
ncbi:MAG: hypothetical protein COA79_22935 [Planctomycetota bacterium]|nr:MAG: hypothetical protein COA79_22935 [Planctomycetota bacterium]